MPGRMKSLSQSLVFRIVLFVWIILLCAICTWTLFSDGLYFMDTTGHSARIIHTQMIALALAILCLTSMFIILVLRRFFTHPINRLIDATQRLAKGEDSALAGLELGGELGRLARTIKQMGQEISLHQRELRRQKNEYQQLFEMVPCLITVQDRSFRLIGYNEEFSKKFDPVPGDYCYSAYKGRDKKCEFCPVEKTFADGESHVSEETAVNRDGSMTHWVVKTAPMKNEKGEIVGAMELSLDMTQVKELKGQLEASERQYRSVFNNIPNPIFLLDTDTLDIIDCNQSACTVYGYEKAEILNTSFPDLYEDKDKVRIKAMVSAHKEMNNVRHITKRGETLFVNVWISPSQFRNRDVLLVSTRDITARVEAELQLIQASKMATLGEMATGVAHELNQPLTVIKTVSSFFIKKIRNKEKIPEDILKTLAEEVDSHVDRAANIINHMRQFGRKSDIETEMVYINDVLKEAFNIFSQQFKLREIDVVWDLEKNLPPITAEPIRLEQVFINLLTNARDAIDAKWETQAPGEGDEKTISLQTNSTEGRVFLEICDSGCGIPSNIADKIFEPFFTTKKVGEGTGIGLSISYGIIKDFNGNISVTSKPGEGACFTISFPRETA